MSTTPAVKEMLLQQLLPRFPLLPLNLETKHFNFSYRFPHITQTSRTSALASLSAYFPSSSQEDRDHVLEKAEWGGKSKPKTSWILEMEGNYKPSPIWSTD